MAHPNTGHGSDLNIKHKGNSPDSYLPGHTIIITTKTHYAGTSHFLDVVKVIFAWKERACGVKPLIVSLNTVC